MIPKPDTVAKAQRGGPFDRVAAALIGSVAVIAAFLAVIQATQSQAGARAQLLSARLAADLSARISVATLVHDFAAVTALQGLELGLNGTGRQLAGLQLGDDAAVQIGRADFAASEKVQAAVDASVATTATGNIDAYFRDLVTSRLQDIQPEFLEQRQLVDEATAAGGRSRVAVLGLSLSALAGVLIGLGLVLREGRPGWAALTVAGTVEVLSVVAAVGALL